MKKIMIALFTISILLGSGCKTTPVKPDLPIVLTPIKTPLLVEDSPILREVVVYSPDNPNAVFCLSDRSYKDALINIELLKSWGVANYTIITKYNTTQTTSTTDTKATTK